MNAVDLFAALDLPPGANVNQRVPKKLLVEHGAPTAADKRRISDGIEEVYWLATLKPTTVGVPVYRDSVREYLEVAVLRAALRTNAKADRLTELLHRAIPYPVFLIYTHGERLAVSLAHKRWSQGETGETVLDGELVGVDMALDRFREAFLASLALAQQPRTHLLTLYQGWMDKAVALLAARVTGTFTTTKSLQRARVRRDALRECARLDEEITRLRATASKERQIARQVELNLELKRVERQRSEAIQRL